MTREDRTKGFFVAFDYTSDALREIDAFFRKSSPVGRVLDPTPTPHTVIVGSRPRPTPLSTQPSAATRQGQKWAWRTHAWAWWAKKGPPDRND